MSHKHLTTDERIFIYKLLEDGNSISRSDKILNRNKSTISRKLKRLGKKYDPYKADKDAKKKSKIG